MERIESGTILNERYEVVNLIGEGGMSVVYEGRDVATGTPVALKVLKGDFSNDEQRIEKLRKEAHALRALRHPNIVKVFGIGHWHGNHYIAMEKIDGVTISEIVGSGGSLEWRDSTNIILQVLDALKYTHACGVIHKDIKPQNILVDETKHATLTDFGIAENRASSDTIHAGQNEFSVYYMSPEQARAGVVDSRSDIYSLGVTFYEMLVGSMPFDGETQYAVILKLVKENIIPAHVVDSSIPRAVSDVVVQATMKDPNKRFQSADEMISALKRAVENPYVPLLPNSFYKDNGLMLPNDDENRVAVDDSDVKTEIDEQLTIPGSDFDDEDESDTAGIGDKILAVAAYLIGIAAAVAAIVFTVNFALKKLSPKAKTNMETTYVLDNYEGHKADAVAAMLKEFGIQTDMNTVTSDLYPSGYVLGQDIAAGTVVKEGDKLKLDVIAKTGYVVLNDYTGESVTNIKKLLPVGIEVKEIQVSDVLTAGTIIKTEPTGGNEIAPNGTITVYVSRGNMGKTVAVPDLCGFGQQFTLEQAEKVLKSLGLKVGNVYPSPEEDLTPYFEAKAAEKAAEEAEKATLMPSETPTLAPTETPGPTKTPEPTETPRPEDSEGPDETTDSDEDITADETPEMTTEPTDTPEPTATARPTMIPTPTMTPEPITPSPEPTVNPEYMADLFVVEQYPPAGTQLYEGDTVDLYFFGKSKLDELAPTKKVTLDYPAGVTAESGNLHIYIKNVMQNHEEKNEHITATISDFPLTVKVPFCWKSETTEMYIYVEDMSSPFEKRVVNLYDGNVS